MTSCFIAVLVLFALLPAQSYSMAEGKGSCFMLCRGLDSNEFTAEFMAEEGYYAAQMPVSLRIKFSSAVIDLDVTHFLVSHGGTIDFRQRTATSTRCRESRTLPTNFNSLRPRPEK